MGFLEGILYMLWRGIAIGVIISAPMGPVGILCIQRTLAKGRRTGFYTGVGAAISDLFYCLLTGFGLSFIEEFLERNQNVIQIIGSVVLIGFAVYLFRSNPSRSIKKPGESDGSPKRDIINGFLFTVSNPLIIFLIIGLFARFNFLLPEIQLGHYIVGFICIIAGALGWWWMVTFFVDKVRSHFNLRSMWLINKIIGSVIAIFGIVGIITAVSGMVNAATRQTLYLNSVRGFGGDGHANGTGLMIDGNDADPQYGLQLTGTDFTFGFRARNLHNDAAARYDTGHGKVRNPGWAVSLCSPRDTVVIRFKTIDDFRDDLGPKALTVKATRGDSLCFSTGLRDNLDWGTGWNAYSVVLKEGKLQLLGGERRLHPIFDIDAAGFVPSYISISADPGALVEADWMELTQAPKMNAEMGYVADPDVMHSYMQRSEDDLEGVWEIWERSLDEDQLTMGGKYRLLIADNGSYYEIIYLDGASKYPGHWTPGKLKAVMKPTSFRNVFDVTWYDAAGNEVDTEIKAQYLDPSLITIQFPYLQSSLQLRKVMTNL